MPRFLPGCPVGENSIMNREREEPLRGSLSLHELSVADLLGMQTAWDTFVKTASDNPIFLSGFVSYFMELEHQAKWNPHIVVMKREQDLVGLALLKVRGDVAEFLLAPSYSPDLVVLGQFRRTFLEELMKLLFVKLRCQFVDFTLPSESPTVQLLRRWAKGISMELPVDEPYADSHSVLEVKGSWKDFCDSRGKNFTRHFAKIERKLTNAGAWRISNSSIDNPGTVAKIHEIEKNSWKNVERKGREDPYLEATLDYWKRAPPETAFFTPQSWLLELKDEPIAYAIVLRLNGHAFIAKTSYDARYDRFYPGEFIQNSAIREMYDSGAISKIDFMSILSYHRRWSRVSIPRTRIVTARGIVPSIRILIRRNKALHVLVSKVIASVRSFKFRHPFPK